MIISETVKISGKALESVQKIQKEYDIPASEAVAALIGAGREYNEGDSIKYYAAVNTGVDHISTEADLFVYGELVGFRTRSDKTLYGRVTGHPGNKVILFLTESSRKLVDLSDDAADNYEVPEADVFHL